MSYPVPLPEGEGIGFEGYAYAGFPDLPGDVALASDLLALVEGGSLVLRSTSVDDQGLTVGADVAVFSLPSVPLGYHLSAVEWDLAPDAGDRVGCLLTWWDAGSRRSALAWVVRQPSGGYGQGLVRFHEEASSQATTCMFGAYDPVSNVMVAAIGEAGGTLRWRQPFTVRLQTQDSVEEEGTGTVEQIHLGGTPTTCLRVGEDAFLIASSVTGDPDITDFILGAQHDIIQGALGGQGCVVDGVAYVPTMAFAGNPGPSDLHLWRYVPGQAPERLDVVVATVMGTANTKPTDGRVRGLIAQRLLSISSGLEFLASAGGMDEWITGLLTGSVPPADDRTRLVVTASVPDQPSTVPNPRAFPSYAMLVDTEGIVVGPKFRLGYGDVTRLTTHPDGFIWALVERWDNDAEIPAGAPSGGGLTSEDSVEGHIVLRAPAGGMEFVPPEPLTGQTSVASMDFLG